MSRREFLATQAAMLASAAPSAGLLIATVSQEIRRKKVSPVELVQQCLKRIEALNPRLNAFITVTAEQALEEAKAREAEQMRGRVRGPMHGIPVGLKDLVDTAGVRTTCASAGHASRVPKQDASVVARLREAGAVVVGKCNMDEFAYNFTGETSHFGVCHNPWKHGYTPGGSSGGSAVAVAAGMCLGAVGSDTGGSIRLPASFCGIAGLKPSYGLIPVDGVTPLAKSMDHLGPMCRTAADAALMLGAMAKAAYRLEPGVKKLRVGVARDVYFSKLDAGVADAVGAAIRVLGDLAAAVVDIEMPEVPMLPIVRAEAFAYHQAGLAANGPRLHPHTLHEINEGAGVTAAQYEEALREMRRLRGVIGKVFDDVDVIVTPTAPAAAFPLDPNRKPDLVYLRNTLPFNILGIPVISVPCGFTGGGLPVGMQLAGPAGGDAKVLAVAAAYERAVDWVRMPPIA